MILMVAREGALGTLQDVLRTPYATFLRVVKDYEVYYPPHVVLSQIARGLSGETPNSEPKREWNDEVDDWPPGYDHSAGLSEGEAWQEWLNRGNKWD